MCALASLTQLAPWRELAFLFPNKLVWPYVLGGIVLLVGCVTLIRRREEFQAHRIESLGPVLVGIGMAIFGADHFIFTPFVASIVPRWIPWHLFWTYFVGTALIAAALALASGKLVRLAVGLLGIMILLFVILMHIPNCVRFPHNVMPYKLALRDLALGGGLFAAGAGGSDWLDRASAARVLLFGRFVLAAALAVWGVHNFMAPASAPGINDTDVVLMVGWIPAHALWSYLAGVVFLGCSLGLLIPRYARRAATLCGTACVIITVVAYLPLVIAKPLDIDTALNYLAIHAVLAGVLLLLADALRCAEAVADVREGQQAFPRAVEDNAR